MKFALLIIFLFVIEAKSFAAPAPQILYYYSTARIIDLQSGGLVPLGSVATQKVLLIKSLDPANNMIAEIACIQSPNTPAEMSPVFMKVQGNSVVAISDNIDFTGSKIHGTGTLSGAPWDWNLLTFSIDTDFCPSTRPCPAHVDDVNFVVHGQTADGVAVDQLIGRKQIYSIPERTPVQLYDLEMNKITADQYIAYYKLMGCHKD